MGDGRSPSGDGSVGEQLAQEIRRYRILAGQAQLAQETGYSLEYVSRAQRPNKGLPSGELVLAIDRAVGANGTLVALHADALAERRARRPARLVDTSAVRDIASALIDAGTDVSDSGWSFRDDGASATGTVVVEAPAGRFFTGTEITVAACPTCRCPGSRWWRRGRHRRPRSAALHPWLRKAWSCG